MKRVLILAAIMFLAGTDARAMTPLSEHGLSDVTGQAGVNINPDLTMNISLGTMSWGDTSGLDAPWDLTDSDTGGSTGLNNLLISNLRVRSRDTDTYGGYQSSTSWRPITIDVATDPARYGGATFVRIGEGALHLSFDSLQAEVANGLSGNLLNQTLGQVYLGGLDLYVNPGSYIDIYNGRGGGQSGVTMTLNLVDDRIGLSAVSWGDLDGLPAGSAGDPAVWIAPAGSAGYAGLFEVSMDLTSVVGTLAINVCTSDSGAYRDMNGGTASIVHVSFPADLRLSTDRLTADVRLDATPQLAGPHTGTLGSIFIQGFGLTVLAGSWVDIWAH